MDDQHLASDATAIVYKTRTQQGRTKEHIKVEQKTLQTLAEGVAVCA